MSAFMDFIKDKLGNTILPITSTKAVYDENDNSLDDIITSLKDNELFVSVKSLGCKGDGTTDDTNDFQYAINYAIENGKILFIDEGTYAIFNRLVISSPLTIIGASKDKSIISYEGDYYHTETPYDTNFWEESNACILIKGNNSEIANLTIIGGTHESPNQHINGIIMHYPKIGENKYDSAQRVALTNLDIKYFKNNLFMYAGWNRYITRCYFVDAYKNGVYYKPLDTATVGNWSGSGDVYIACQFVGNKDYGFYADSLFETVIWNSIFEYNGSAIKTNNCNDIIFKNAWNEANYNNIEIVGSCKFEGGYNIGNETVQHTVLGGNDIVQFESDTMNLVCKEGEVVFKQESGIIKKGVSIGSEDIENLVQNPYFVESSQGTSTVPSLVNWERYVEGASTAIADTPNYCRILVEGRTSDTYFGITSADISVNPSDTYNYSVELRTPDRATIDKGCVVGLVLKDANKTVVTRESNTITMIGDNNWELKEFITTIPNGIYYVQLTIYVNQNGNLHIRKPIYYNTKDTLKGNVVGSYDDKSGYVQFYNLLEEKVYPKTFTKYVFDEDNNKTLDTLLSEKADKTSIPTVPTKLSSFTDDLGSSPTHTHSQYLTSFTETDPTVPSWAKQPNKPTYTASEVGALPSTTTHLSGDISTSEKGVANGVAELDANGFVVSSQLPSYVDDVVEYDKKSDFPKTGESGKIYIDKSTNITYRWGGSQYVAIGSDLALGETSSTAYAGNKGKKNADDIIEINETLKDNGLVNAFDGQLRQGHYTYQGDFISSDNDVTNTNKINCKANDTIFLSYEESVSAIWFNFFTQDGTSISYDCHSLDTNELLGIAPSNASYFYFGMGKSTSFPVSSVGNIVVNVNNRIYQIEQELDNHISDTTKHITDSERTNWNSKTSNTGTVTSVAVKMNGSTKGTVTTSGTIDLGTVITSHQDISGKQDKLTAGSNITISGSTISAKDTTYSTATTSANGLMSSTDKTKLDGIASGANNYSLPTASASTLGGVKVGTNLSISNGVLSATNTTYSSKTASSGGTDVSLVTTGEKYTWNDKQDKITYTNKLDYSLISNTPSMYDYMPKNDPFGVGTFSMNRKSSTVVGEKSVAEGYNATASGKYSHAEGNTTISSGISSHAEGNASKSSGETSHAEGYYTTSSGMYSHAEGYSAESSGITSHAEGLGTESKGYTSHTEGIYTIASSTAQHAQGKYNIEDTKEKYAHIVGGGTSDSARKNIHTLDWDGNAEFAGEVTSNSNGNKVNLTPKKVSSMAEYNALSDADKRGIVVVDDGEPTADAYNVGYNDTNVGNALDSINTNLDNYKLKFLGARAGTGVGGAGTAISLPTNFTELVIIGKPAPSGSWSEITIPYHMLTDSAQYFVSGHYYTPTNGANASNMAYSVSKTSCKSAWASNATSDTSSQYYFNVYYR